jgi:hypothetical protein
VAGAAGGLAGVWAMSLFSAAWEKVLPASAGRPEPHTVNIAEARRSPPMHASQQEWDSTMMTATALAHKVLHWPLTLEEFLAALPGRRQFAFEFASAAGTRTRSTTFCGGTTPHSASSS